MHLEKVGRVFFAKLSAGIGSAPALPAKIMFSHAGDHAMLPRLPDSAKQVEQGRSYRLVQLAATLASQMNISGAENLRRLRSLTGW
jgi:hypothetical protein